MPLGDQFLEVVAPTREGTAAGRYLQRRSGPGGYMGTQVWRDGDTMVITLCKDAEERDSHLEALGVQIAFRHRSESMNICQLHPASTGGSFFEIDWQPAALRSPDHWGASGGKERVLPARHTRVVRGISGAELQSPEPTLLAKRWSEIAGLSLEKNAADELRLSLAGGHLRFAPCKDGRPEGLGAVDLEVTDRTRLLSEARRRGCAASANQVEICGLRFRLRG